MGTLGWFTKQGGADVLAVTPVTSNVLIVLAVSASAIFLLGLLLGECMRRRRLAHRERQLAAARREIAELTSALQERRGGRR